MTLLLICLCLVIVFYDVLYRRVPNKLLFICLVIHVGCLLMTGQGIDGVDIYQSILGGVIAFVLLIPFYIWRVMGAGDVKFFTLLGLLLGTSSLIPLWVISSLLAGVHASVIYLSRAGIIMLPSGLHQALQQLSSSPRYQQMLDSRQGRKGIPYAAYLAIAAIAATTGGQQWTSFMP